jgi:hypothetical protein
MARCGLSFVCILSQLNIMANKALAKRQKLAFRIEPSQKSMKPRNPVAIAAKQRTAAGPHRKTASAQRQVQQRSLKKLLTEPDKH